MKNIRIPFSIEKYNKGGYQVTDGLSHSIRIICTNKKGGKYPIVTLLTSDDIEGERSYTENRIRER